MFIQNNTIFSGPVENKHYHFGQAIMDLEGVIHLFLRKGDAHSVESGATIYHMKSFNFGKDWTTPVAVVGPDSGYDYRGVSAICTKNGRIVLIYSKSPAPSASPQELHSMHSDDGDNFVYDGMIVSIPFNYGLTYGGIKEVPRNDRAGFRLVFTPYYRVTSTPTYKLPTWYADEDGENWSEGVPIQNELNGHNEAELLAFDADRWIAVARGNGLNLYTSTNGGETSWSLVGSIDTEDGVSPCLRKFCHLGKTYAVLMYCDRTLNKTVVKLAEADDIFANGVSAFGDPLFLATDMVNASGYNCMIDDPRTGLLYSDGGVPYVEFKEYDGQPYSDVRFKTFNIFDLLPVATGGGGECDCPEEAEWIETSTAPTLFGTSGGTAPTYNSAATKTQYLHKEGAKIVHFRTRITLTNKGAMTGSIRVDTGLPFTQSSTVELRTAITFAYWHNMSGPTGKYPCGLVLQDTNHIMLLWGDNTTANNVWNGTHLNNNSEFYINGTLAID